MDNDELSAQVALFSEVIDRLVSHKYMLVDSIPLRIYPDTEHLRTYELHYAKLEPSKCFQACSDSNIYHSSAMEKGLPENIYELFFLNIPGEKIEYEHILGPSVFDELMNSGFIIRVGEKYRMLFRFAPIRNSIWVTSAFDRSLKHFTYLSYDSIIFAELVMQSRRVTSKPQTILDYGCGIGYVGLAAKRKQDHLVGVDINPYSVWLSKINSRLQHQNGASFIVSGEPPKNDQYDLIYCNPPFVFMPQEYKSNIDSYGGGEYGAELSLKFLAKFEALLKPNGRGYMITSSAQINGEDYLYNALKDRFTNLTGTFYNLCDFLPPQDERLKALGIEKTKHVFLDFSRLKEKGEPGWTIRSPKGNAKYKYAF